MHTDEESNQKGAVVMSPTVRQQTRVVLQPILRAALLQDSQLQSYLLIH